METERKYLTPDFALTRLRLAKLGATTQGPHFESNIIFDTSDSRLYATGCLLRLRLQEWRGRCRSIITLKYPCVQPIASVKALEELETGVENGAIMKNLLEYLGYREVARYEKIREPWQINFGDRLYTIDLDTVPFGEVVEIEGEPAGMDRLAESLGLDKFKISLKTYHELNQEWRKDNGLERNKNLLFDPAARGRLRASLGLAR